MPLSQRGSATLQPYAMLCREVGASLVELLVRAWVDGTLRANVPPEWRHDSAAAPSGASSLRAEMSCYWDSGEAFNGTCLYAAARSEAAHLLIPLPSRQEMTGLHLAAGPRRPP